MRVPPPRCRDAVEPSTAPDTELIAVVVVEPPDPLPCRIDGGDMCAGRPRGDLRCRACGAIPAVDLERPACVADEHATFGTPQGPIGQRHAGSTESCFPRGLRRGTIPRSFGGRVEESPGTRSAAESARPSASGSLAVLPCQGAQHARIKRRPIGALALDDQFGTAVRRGQRANGKSRRRVAVLNRADIRPSRGLRCRLRVHRATVRQRRGKYENGDPNHRARRLTRATAAIMVV